MPVSNYWSSNDIELLKKLYSNELTKDIAVRLRRSVKSITRMAERLKLTKNKNERWKAMSLGKRKEQLSLFQKRSFLKAISEEQDRIKEYVSGVLRKIEEDKSFLVWLAGFFDGEGCVHISKAKVKTQISPHFELQIAISQKDREVLEYIKNKVGGFVYSSNGHTSFWGLHSRKASTILKLIEPFLLVKREEALLGIEFQDNHWNAGRTGVPLYELKRCDVLRSALLGIRRRKGIKGRTNA